MRSYWIIGICGLLCLFTACGNKKNSTVKSDTPSLEAGVYQKGQNVMFVYKTQRSDVKSVELVGDFSGDRKPIPLVYKDNVWRVVLKLDYGIYQYKYRVNGKEMVTDPAAQAYAPDGEGGRNAIVEITAESE